MMYRISCLALLGLLACGCSESVGSSGSGTVQDPGKELAVDVPASGRAFVRLTTPEVLSLPDDGSTSAEWDLAFTGYDVLTNSGPSGPAEGGAFGPLDPSEFQSQAPEVPFLTTDETGGAFLDWFDYDGNEHVVWSRYHVFGVQEAGRYWKVQVLTFYGDVQGAPVSALYQIRYAEVMNGSIGPTTELIDIDATAGGSAAPDNVPSAALDLDTGMQSMLTPSEALLSSGWHLYFRRASISVNGELGGPRGVRAVDLDADKSASETLEQNKTKTSTSELPHFDAIDFAQISDPSLEYRGDRIISAFSGYWLADGSNPPAPEAAAWVVRGADGMSQFVLVFDRFEGATDASPGRVIMRVRRL